MHWKNFIFIIAVIGMISCNKPQQQEPPTPQAERTIPVQVVKVSEKKFAERIRVNGLLNPLWRVEVYSTSSGKIIDKQVQLGDRVSRGQVLTRLIQDIPGLEFSPITVDAPVSGVIVADQTEVGARISPQRSCFEIANLDTLTVNAQLIESDVSLIKKNSPCRITVPALPSQQFKGFVWRIDPQLNSRTRTAEAVIRLVNSSQTLRPGMSATCEFEVMQRTVLTLPLDALVQVGAGYRIVKILNGRARFADINGGTIMNNDMEVFGDVALNDLVVVYGQNLLQDGSAVEIQP